MSFTPQLRFPLISDHSLLNITADSSLPSLHHFKLLRPDFTSGDIIKLACDMANAWELQRVEQGAAEAARVDLWR